MAEGLQRERHVLEMLRMLSWLSSGPAGWGAPLALFSALMETGVVPGIIPCHHQVLQGFVFH